MRRICYITGTRADFGLMVRTLHAIDDEPSLKLGILVTGMHLSPKYGSTVEEIRAQQFHIMAEIRVDIETSSRSSVAIALGQAIIGMTGALERESPDLVLLLGDRGEMLAGAIAAIHLNLPIVHIHGGERSGTVDEPVRHAISKLAHYHFVTTKESRKRLVRMGESPSRVFVTGAPGLDGLQDEATQSRKELHEALGLDPSRETALMVFHPVLQESDQAGAQVHEIIQAAFDEGLQLVAFMPNADAGGDSIRTAIESYREDSRLRIATHLMRSDYVSWLAAADVMLGNSSSGIIEAATFGTPVVNIGSRQNLRERNANVTDVSVSREEIAAAIRGTRKSRRRHRRNIYGDGNTAREIVRLLQDIPIDPAVMLKVNEY